MSVASRMPMDAYLQLAADDPEGFWELWDGEPRSKPGTTWEQGNASSDLGWIVRSQLDVERLRMRINPGRLLLGGDHAFIPDVMVLPVEYGEGQRGQPERAERFERPVPFVVEVWSRPAAEYDLEAKLRAFRERGGVALWLLNPYDRTLRRRDGGYDDERIPGGSVALRSLPGVVVALDALFVD